MQAHIRHGSGMQHAKLLDGLPWVVTCAYYWGSSIPSLWQGSQTCWKDPCRFVDRAAFFQRTAQSRSRPLYLYLSLQDAIDMGLLLGLLHPFTASEPGGDWLIDWACLPSLHACLPSSHTHHISPNP